MSKDNNQFKVDCAFPGLCGLCNTEIAEFNGSHPNGKPKITCLKGNACSTRIRLDNGSLMRVSLCNECLDKFKPEDAGPLMESHINGWQNEIDRAGNWTEQKKCNHMKVFSKYYMTDWHDKPWNVDELKKIKKPKKSKLKVRT